MILALCICCGILVGLAAYSLARDGTAGAHWGTYIGAATVMALITGSIIPTSSTEGAVSLRSVIVASIGSLIGVGIVAAIKKNQCLPKDTHHER